MGIAFSNRRMQRSVHPSDCTQSTIKIINSGQLYAYRWLYDWLDSHRILVRILVIWIWGFKEKLKSFQCFINQVIDFVLPTKQSLDCGWTIHGIFGSKLGSVTSIYNRRSSVMLILLMILINRKHSFLELLTITCKIENYSSEGAWYSFYKIAFAEGNSVESLLNYIC